jgi:hypothetical protein
MAFLFSCLHSEPNHSQYPIQIYGYFSTTIPNFHLHVRLSSFPSVFKLITSPYPILDSLFEPYDILPSTSKQKDVVIVNVCRRHSARILLTWKDVANVWPMQISKESINIPRLSPMSTNHAKK